MRFRSAFANGGMLSLVLLLAGTSPTRAGTIEVLNTGYDNVTHSLYSPYTLDAKYTIRSSDGGTYYPQARDASGLPGTYTPAPANSRWDYLVNTPTSTGPDYVPVAYYAFVTYVTLTPSQAATAQISGLQAAADNQFLAVAINGTNVWYSSEGGPIEDFHSLINIGDVGQGYFQSGVNKIEFYIYNQGFGYGQDPSPAALLVVGDLTAASSTPAPSGLVLFGLGAIGCVSGCWFGHRRSVGVTAAA